MTDRPLPPAGTDEDDGRRVEQRADADRLGAVLAGLHDGEGLLRRVDPEAQRDQAVLVPVVDLVPGVPEDTDHLAVLRQHLGDETVQAVLAGDHGEVLEQDRPDPRARGERR